MGNSGYTTTSALADSLPTLVTSARVTRRYEGVMPNLVDKQTLGEGVGNTWTEVTFANLIATAVSETQKFDNPQQLSDTSMSVEPTVVGIHTTITDRVAKRLSKVAYAKTGQLGQSAIQKIKDEHGIIVLDGATTSLCGAGSTLTSGHIDAAVRRITSNATEPGMPPIYIVLHGYQIKDLRDELIAGIGTYAIPEGESARVYREGFRGNISGAQVFENGNILPDSADDAKGGVFAKEAIVMVQGRTPWVETERVQVGGGATAVYHYDEFAYGERSPGNWLFEILSDCTAPTS